MSIIGKNMTEDFPGWAPLWTICIVPAQFGLSLPNMIEHFQIKSRFDVGSLQPIIGSFSNNIVPILLASLLHWMSSTIHMTYFSYIFSSHLDPRNDLRCFDLGRYCNSTSHCMQGSMSIQSNCIVVNIVSYILHELWFEAMAAFLSNFWISS